MNPINELIALCESSLDDRPDFRKAVANANQYHNHASVEQCQQKAVLLRDALQSMDNDDESCAHRSRDCQLMIGESATFADECQSMLKKAIKELE